MMEKVEQSISNNCLRCAGNGGSLTAKKRGYSGLLFSPLPVELDNSILTGSVMEQKIKVQQVTVEEYQPGFDTPNNDFEITFE